jgi:hypothetical protein
MDSGDMRASDLMGPFRLVTRSKDIRLTGVNGDVRVENENGAMEIHMNKLGNMQLSNRNSDVQIYLPDKAGFQVDARSRGGEIESDFSALKIDNGEDQATASGAVGEILNELLDKYAEYGTAQRIVAGRGDDAAAARSRAPMPVPTDNW